MSSSILIFNSGSSSIKFALYRKSGGDLTRALSGMIDDVDEAPKFTAREAQGGTHECELPSPSSKDGARDDSLSYLLSWLRTRVEGSRLIAAGHRVVHGADRYLEPVVVDRDVLAHLRSFVPLAPLHQGHNLEVIEALERIAPDLRQVACFDTAFHATQPRLATLYAIPRSLSERGLRRYGFHGLSYEFIARVLPDYLGDRAQGRVIVAHLGSGASLCAMRQCRSVATSMGFSPLEGLVMGTRPGTLDSGVLLYLMRELGMNETMLSDLLYHRSGLLGVSEISHDMRALLASSDKRAAEAVDLFVYRAVTQIGSLVAALGGLDALVFTAGIGERAAAVRARICEALSWLGMELDIAANNDHGPCITRRSSTASAWVIPTDEEQMIARHVERLAGNPVG